MRLAPLQCHEHVKGLAARKVMMLQQGRTCSSLLNQADEDKDYAVSLLGQFERSAEKLVERRAATPRDEE